MKKHFFLLMSRADKVKRISSYNPKGLRGRSWSAVNLKIRQPAFCFRWFCQKMMIIRCPRSENYPQEKIDTLAKWIEIGLPFPKEVRLSLKNDHSHASTTEVNEATKSHWAFKPPVDHDVPNGKYGDIQLIALFAKTGQRKLPLTLLLQT